MNKTLFMSLEKHEIYYVSENNLSFFIAIPTLDYKKTNISIELRGDYETFNLNTNDLEYVKSLIKDVYSKIDNYNISLVIPITENNELKDVRVDSNDITYAKLDNVIGKVINNAYVMLNENGIEVENKIIFINNDKYKTFIKWFLEKYGERCEYKSLLELMTASNNSNISLNKLEMTDINFVIGKEEPEKEETSEEELNNLEVDSDLIIDEIDLPTNYVKHREESQMGYVSYCLLGIMSVIISLVLLYILI